MARSQPTSKPRGTGTRMTTAEAMRLHPERFVTPAEAAAAKAAKDQAQARTPREVLEAFAPLPLRVGGIKLQPLSLAAFMVLERLDSPFSNENLSAEALADINATDLAVMVFVLSRPPVESLDLLGNGRAAFDRAVLEFATAIPATELRDVGEKVGRIIVHAFATIITGQKKTQAASSTPPPATASAGG